jgi:S1-C subfamily serine protease
MMTARFAELGGGRAAVDLTDIDSEGLEKVWGDTGYKPLKWLQSALERAYCVARLGPDVYEGTGTGFLIDPTWIRPSWAGRHLLLTNAHVCTNDEEIQRQFPYPSPPEKTVAAFLGLARASDPVEVRVAGLVWTSRPSELDATLLEIKEPPAGTQLPPLASQLPQTHGPGARVNIVGHPKGLGVRVSLQDNELTSIGDRYLHYRTPTDPGSSGSPIFNQEWELIGLHHSASTARQANEGIRIDVILDAIRQELSG